MAEGLEPSWSYGAEAQEDELYRLYYSLNILIDDFPKCICLCFVNAIKILFCLDFSVMVGTGILIFLNFINPESYILDIVPYFNFVIIKSDKATILFMGPSFGIHISFVFP